MVIASRGAARTRLGMVSIELVVALGILGSTLLPLAYSFVQEQRAARAYYFRAIAMELVDGEMEVLAAGAWRAYPPGRHSHPVRANAARNLPAGEFTLTVQEGEVRLEWQPARPNMGGPVVRSMKVTATKEATQ